MSFVLIQDNKGTQMVVNLKKEKSANQETQVAQEKRDHV